MQTIFIIFGSVSLVFAFIGLIAPIIPAMPFVVLAAYCFARGSKRFHAWLTQHYLFGPMLERYHQFGTPPWIKWATAGSLTISIAVSFWFIDFTTPRVMLVLTWLFACYLIYRLPYYPGGKKASLGEKLKKERRRKRSERKKRKAAQRRS